MILLVACTPEVVEDTGLHQVPLELGPVQRCSSPVREGWELQEPFHGGEPSELADGGSVLVEDLDGDGFFDLIASWDQGTALHVYTGPDWTEQELPAITPSQLSRTPFGFITGGGRPTRYHLDLQAWDTVEGLTGGVREALWVQGVGLVLLMDGPAGDGMDLVIGGAPLDEVANQTAFDGVVFDHDGDGDQDLYVVNDNPLDGHNVLWHQEDGALIPTDFAALAMSGMGVDLGDVNRDGRADLYLTAAGENRLLLGQEDGRFVDVTAVWGASPIVGQGMGWGGVFWDADNDGDLDLMTAEGDFTGSHSLGLGPQPLSLLRNEEDRFHHEPWAEGNFRAVVPVDLNDDGVLDLVVSRVVEGPMLFLSTGCTEAGWLRVEGPPGAKVTLLDTGQTAWISTDSGFGGARPASVHLGAGSAEWIRVAVEVEGRRSVVEVEPRRVLKVLDSEGH